ncbi:MAG: PEP-CTERM sorting domain-containing protein [Pirellulales bacterium]
MRKPITVCLLAAFGLMLVPATAPADDFAPPPWDRAHPNAVTAEWEFSAPASPIAPDGPLTNVGVKGSGTLSTTATIFASGWGAGDGDGGWFFAPDFDGSIYFEVDNVVDLEPVKHMWVQVTHTPGLALGIDPLFAENFSVFGSTPGSISMIPHGPTSTIFFWDIFPNPAAEVFTLHVFSTGEIDQIVVDTISIPEPSTLALAAFGLIGLAAWGWRRKRSTSTDF